MTDQMESFSFYKPFDIYTDKYILSVPLLETVHKLLTGVGDGVLVDENTFISDTFKSMSRVIDCTDVVLTNMEKAVIFNKTLRLKGALDSVVFFFESLGISVEISYVAGDSRIYFAILDFNGVEITDLPQFEMAYETLINELLYFGNGNYIYDELVITYDFYKQSNSEITASFTNMININKGIYHIKVDSNGVPILDEYGNKIYEEL